MCLMYMEFKPLEDMSSDVPVNTTAAWEHVADIECSIRVIKDCCQSVLSEIPYKQGTPDIFIVFLLQFVVLWLNVFPSNTGVSTKLSPLEIVTGLCMDYLKHCRARWGAYAEASQDPDITNKMNDHTVLCIVLGPTGNVQGSISCCNLKTKQVVKRQTIKHQATAHARPCSKELRQLHDYVTYTSVHTHEPTPDQKKQALVILIFLTKKRCGRIKTRECVNGSTQ
eukprot:CCRYP_002270-RA/>CCRYP_002270-RA protein AED:0.39 eAED:0.36 QI:0/0/0/1/0/0/2/0/224